jgi:hypothetical protein
MEFSGTQTYATDAHQWQAEHLTSKLTGKVSAQAKRGTDVASLTLKMISQNASPQHPATPPTDSRLTDSNGSQLPSGQPDSGPSSMSTDRSGSGGEFNRPSPSVAAPTATNAASSCFYSEGRDWEIPIQEPRTPVLAENYQSAKTQNIPEVAEIMYNQVNQFKSDGNYEIAENVYKQAIKAKPGFAIAEYQLACCYALNKNRLRRQRSSSAHVNRGWMITRFA